MRVLSFSSRLKIWTYPSVIALWSQEDNLRSRKLQKQSLYKSDIKVIDCSSESFEELNIYSEAKVRKMPLRFLPNVSKFEIKAAPLDWLMALFGFGVRCKVKSIQYRNNQNGPTNRKLFILFLELEKLRDAKEWSQYWSKAWRLMKSKEYQISSFNFTHEHWYKSWPIQRVDSVLASLRTLIDEKQTEIDFKRVYIPKINGNLRPLGVPSDSWRVYLHMINNLITFARIGREGSQHGYLPQRGVHTCWKEILEKVNAKYIYEFDLKGFFDNVPHELINFKLKNTYQMPAFWLELIDSLNKSIVKLSSVDVISEADNIPFLDGLGIVNTNWVNNYRNLSTLDGKTIFNKRDKSKVSYKATLFKEKGIPQGAATSPTLSTLCLEDVLLKNHPNSCITMYADDGLIFSETVEGIGIIKEELAKILEISVEKSGFVKKENVWLKELKFCGIVYNGISKTLKAMTRNGATLEFSVAEQFLGFLLTVKDNLAPINSGQKCLCPKENPLFNSSISSFVLNGVKEFLKEEQPLKYLFSGKWFGFFLSGLYCNSYNKHTEQDVTLKGVRNCWIDKCWPKIKLELLSNSQSNLLLIQQEIEWLTYSLQELVNPKFEWGSHETSSSFGLMLESSLNSQSLIKDVSVSSETSVDLLNGKVDKRIRKLYSELGMLNYIYTYLLESESNSISKLMRSNDISSQSKEFIMKIYSSLVNLNVGNCSSYACFDLMEKYSRNTNLNLLANERSKRRSKILRYRELENILKLLINPMSIIYCKLEMKSLEAELFSGKPLLNYYHEIRDFQLATFKPKVDLFGEGIIRTMSKRMLKEFQLSFVMSRNIDLNFLRPLMPYNYLWQSVKLGFIYSSSFVGHFFRNFSKW